MRQSLFLLDILNIEVHKFARGVREKVLGTFMGKKPKIFDYPAAVVVCSNGSMIVKEWAARLAKNKIDYRFGAEVKSCLGVSIGNRMNGNIVGDCAEQRAVNEFYYRGKRADFDTFVFSVALRPRTMQTLKYCKNCKTLFPQL